MYKVFVNNQSIHFVKNLNNQLFEKESVEIYQFQSKNSMMSIIRNFIDNNTSKELYIYCPTGLYEAFLIFKNYYIEIKAGGGLVENKHKKYLFIFRREKWDLPKGKIDKNETIKNCAIREIEEETGINNLEIIKKLPDTYHLYTDKNKGIIKHCYWFYMQTYSEKPLTPQLKEDITEAVWLDLAEIENVMANSYPSIKSVLNNYFKKNF